MISIVAYGLFPHRDKSLMDLILEQAMAYESRHYGEWPVCLKIARSQYYPLCDEIPRLDFSGKFNVERGRLVEVFGMRIKIKE